MGLKELLAMKTNQGRDGIHISAQLRVDAMQLRGYGIHWAADSIERAAKHIDALEDILLKKGQASAEDHEAKQ